MHRYDCITSDDYRKLIIGKGVIASDFNPSSGVLNTDDILGCAENLCISIEPMVTDMGAKTVNCPENSSELLRLDGWCAKISGRFISCTPLLMKRLIHGAMTESSGVYKITPPLGEAMTLGDVWLVAEYSCVFGEEEAGFFAVKLKNAVSRSGIKLGLKGTDCAGIDFCFSCGSSRLNQEEGFEIYIKETNSEVLS